MQCQMKFFEVLPKGVGQGVQKVAVKMPAQGDPGSGSESSGFADIMAALMSLPADQLRQSLAQLDRVRVEGQGAEWVPLLDLTQSAGVNGGMLKLLKIEPQTGKAAASMFQMKMQQLQNQEQTGPAQGAAMESSALPNLQNLADQEEPVLSPEVRDDLAGMFTKGQAEGEGDGHTGASKDISTELARAAAVRAAKTEIQNEPALDPMLDPLVDAKGVQPLKSGQIFGESPEVATTADKQLPENGAAAFAAAMEKKAAAFRQQNAVPKAAPAAVSHAAAPSAVAGEVDMGASLDTALTQQRPIKKEEGAVAEKAAQGQDDNSVAMPASQTASASKDTVQVVETRLGAAEARSALHAKETGETAAAPKEMQTDVVRQIVQRMTLRNDSGNTSMQIKLKPEFLGNLHMEVVAENHQVTVRMTAENQMVKGILEQNLHVLKNELQQHGLQIQKFDVFVSQDNDAWRHGQQQQTAFRQAQDRGYRSGNGRNGRFMDGEEIGALDGSTVADRGNGEQSSVDFFA